MLSLRFHGRGGQGAKVASRILGTAAFLEGFYVQDFPLYGAERRGAPITAFAHISEDPIMERGVISDPDMVVVMDETLLQDTRAKPLSGLRKNGVILINTSRTPEEVTADHGVEAQVVTLDMTKMSLTMLGEPILSTPAGAAAARIVGIGEESLKEAVENVLAGILSEGEELDENVKLALSVFLAVTPLDITTVEALPEASPVIIVPFEPAHISSPTINALGNSPLRKTGNWRVFRPVWNREVCTKCMACLARCPDGCISLDEEGFPCVDYENCKGCLICVRVCPAEGIERVREAQVL